ncbi:MAG: phosphoribosylamine--glycine ligase [Phycisphaeraceae bacterium]|nr:phosphoribosylamine--glycine ligase [Phycisphaeraceae bacterium]
MAEKVNVLLIGGGGREHAIARKLRESRRLGDLWITHPENAGLAKLGKPVDVPVSIREIYRLEQFCDKNKVGLVVIGPEDPLCEGYADKLKAPGRLVFGPTAEAARLEGDKAWSKQLMRSASIPTGDARIFTDFRAAKDYLASRESPPALDRRSQGLIAKSRDAHAEFPPVIKAAGLAKGKGVIVPHTFKEAHEALERMMVKKEFGDAGKRVVIEERLEGTEVSVLAIVDGGNILVLPACRDHKRLQDADKGPNTGGMGAYCPAENIDEETLRHVEREILVPTIDALRRDGIEYKGVLYAGIMLTPAGPKVLEFNCRFGDPECQPLMARLKSDLIDLLCGACEGTLDRVDVEWDPRAASCVVMAARGYPDAPKKGAVIHGIDDAEKTPDVAVSIAGATRDRDGAIVVSGGRVLSVTGLGATVLDASRRAYDAVAKISFEGAQFRSDIGIAAR